MKTVVCWGKPTRFFKVICYFCMQVYKYFGNILTCFLTVSLDNMKAHELMLGCIVHTKELILAIPIPFFTMYFFITKLF